MPALALAHADANDVLAWPSWASAFGLQWSTNLAGGWQLVTNPLALSGFKNVVTNPASAAQVFYRLKQ